MTRLKWYDWIIGFWPWPFALGFGALYMGAYLAGDVALAAEMELWTAAGIITGMVNAIAWFGLRGEGLRHG